MSAIPPPMASSTANWHWKNKNVTKWGKEWLETELVGIEVKGDGEEVVRIAKMVECDGDMELGQRKSKLITIFDVKVILDWEGTASDGTAVKGRITIPEVSHEIVLDGLSDYVYDYALHTSPATGPVSSAFSLLRSKIPSLLESKFAALPAVMLDVHGKDLTVSTEPSRAATPVASGTSTPAAAAGKSVSAPAAKAPAVKSANKALNTETVVVDATFMASADDLFDILTNEARIPMWTRNSAVSKAQPDTDYSLFGGGVKGKYILLTKPNEIVQTWALTSPKWPEGHEATLTTNLAQSSDSTKVSFTLSGVPRGMEEEIRGNVEGYYIQGLKSIGLGSVL